MSAEHHRPSPTAMYLRVATVIALPLALVALLPGAYATWRVWQIADEANRRSAETRTATCTFVNDLQQRYDATEAYLKATRGRPTPIIPGFPSTGDIEQQQVSRKATLDSFADLGCQRGG